MAFNYSPKIVTDGLVLYLDAANPKSIPVDPTVNLLGNPSPLSSSAGTFSYGGGTYTIGPGYTSHTMSYSAASQSLSVEITHPEVWGAYTKNTTLANYYFDTNVSYSFSFEWKVGEKTSGYNGAYQLDITNNQNTIIVAPPTVLKSSGSSAYNTGTLLSDGFYRVTRTFVPLKTGSVSDMGFRIQCTTFPTGSQRAHFYWRNLQFEKIGYSTPFVSGSRTSWFDLSRNNSTATLLSSSISSSIPQYISLDNRVLKFDGSGSYALIPNIPFNPVGNSDFTISVWVMLNALPSSNPRIISLGSDANNYFNLGTYGGGSPGTYDTFWFEIKKAGTFYGGFWNPSRKYTTSQWYNLVGTSVNSTNTMAFYINGVSVTGDGVSGGAPNVFNSMLIGTNTSPASIVINGRIPQVQMYNRALTAQEILQNYNTTKTRFGLT
jgi:hypothetical protein